MSDTQTVTFLKCGECGRPREKTTRAPMDAEQQLKEIASIQTDVLDLGSVCLALCKAVDPEINLDGETGRAGTEAAARIGLGCLFIMLHQEAGKIAERLCEMEDDLEGKLGLFGGAEGKGGGHE